MKKIACVGSRDIDQTMSEMMEEIGSYVVLKGHVLASGNATGSDQAYARGGNKINPENVWLYLPWSKYEAEARVCGNLCLLQADDSESLINLAKRHHGGWDHLTAGSKKLMVRNAAIVSGANLVIAYPNPKKKWGGGTGHGIKIAKELGIKTILLTETTLAEVKAEIDALCD